MGLNSLWNVTGPSVWWPSMEANYMKNMGTDPVTSYLCFNGFFKSCLPLCHMTMSLFSPGRFPTLLVTSFASKPGLDGKCQRSLNFWCRELTLSPQYQPNDHPGNGCYLGMDRRWPRLHHMTFWTWLSSEDTHDFTFYSNSWFSDNRGHMLVWSCVPCLSNYCCIN